MTETKTVEITVVDEGNYEKTFRLDDPKSNLTLATIRAAFQTAINEGWLLGTSGAPVISVARATQVITSKTKVE